MEAFIVWWIKRDLRLADNFALTEAISLSRESGLPLVAAWLTEPEACSAPEYHIRRDRFVFECLTRIEPELSALRVPLVIFEGSAPHVFEFLSEKGMAHLFSHEETGVLWTFSRDKAIKKVCLERGVQWHELPTNGVVRGLKNRDRWQAHYQARVQQVPLPPPSGSVPSCASVLERVCQSQQTLVRVIRWAERAQSEIGLAAQKCRFVQQRGGEDVAHKLLQRFFQPEIHSSYIRSLSRPHDAQFFSSRLSPYLAFGCISSKQIVFQISRAKLNSDFNGRSLSAFQSRVAWRCHFIQKLENFPQMENLEQNIALKNMRPQFTQEEFERWTAGQTGLPLVDACLRSVHQTGFLNFRMRAMLMSFATHLMWRDWREPAWDLARAFLDFEAGIHFSQVQMQAAVTGNNQIRIYSPLKQSMEQDPDAKFIKQWVPELRAVKIENIHNLDSLPENYPKPIVDLGIAMKTAREQLFRSFKSEAVRSEAKKVQEKLGSRGGPLSWRGQRAARSKKPVRPEKTNQPKLFDDNDDS